MQKIKISLKLAMVVLFLFCYVSEMKAQEYWAKTYGGSGSDYSYAILQTSDGGYVMTGPTASFGAGANDFWVVKLNSSGTVAWQKVYGGSSDEYPNAIQQTTDGGYVVLGRTASFGAGGLDYLVLKLDSSGNITWQKTYGGSSDDYAYAIQQTTDSGYIIGGATLSFGAGSYDFWVLKLDSSGSITWQRTYGGTGIDWPYTLQQTSDGGYVVAGRTDSFGTGGDVWVIKLSSTGDITWQKAYGGTSIDFVLSIQQTSDGGYITAGRTDSFGAGSTDFWVLKLDSSGNIIWQRTYGGSSVDWAFGVRQTTDGGYIVAGRTDSFGAGSSDYWVLKLDSSGNITWQKTYGGGGLDYAYSVAQANDGSYIVGGVNGSFGAGNYDILFLKLDSSGNIGSSCSMIGTTSVSPITPSPTTTTTSVNPGTTTVTPATPNVTAANSSASSTTQCYYASSPGKVLNNLKVTKASGNTVLNWQVPGGTCFVSGYGIYRGTFPVSPYNHASLSCSVTALNYTDATATGNYYYLVVPLNSSNEGSYGTSFNGTTWTERPVGSSPCHPQSLISCN